MVMRFDPLSFAQPPGDAVMDEEALGQLLSPNLPIFEDVTDIPKLSSGMLDQMGMVPYSPEGGGMGNESLPSEPEGLDEEAMAGAILDNAMQMREGSRAAQEKARMLNEQEADTRAEAESGGVKA